MLRLCRCAEPLDRFTLCVPRYATTHRLVWVIAQEVLNVYLVSDIHEKLFLFPRFYLFTHCFTIAGFMFWSSEVGSAHIRPLHPSVFVETGCLTEPGPDTLSRVAGHQALPGNPPVSVSCLQDYRHTYIQAFDVDAGHLNRSLHICMLNNVIALAPLFIYYFSLIQLKLELSIYFYGSDTN